MNSENLSPGNRVPLSMTRHSWSAAADAPALGEGVEASAEDAGQLASLPRPKHTPLCRRTHLNWCRHDNDHRNPHDERTARSAHLPHSKPVSFAVSQTHARQGRGNMLMGT